LHDSITPESSNKSRFILFYHPYSDKKQERRDEKEISKNANKTFDVRLLDNSNGIAGRVENSSNQYKWC